MVYSFNKYLLSTYYIPRTMQMAENIAVKKAKSLFSCSLLTSAEKPEFKS